MHFVIDFGRKSSLGQSKSSGRLPADERLSEGCRFPYACDNQVPLDKFVEAQAAGL